MPPATHPRLSALGGAGHASPSQSHPHQHQNPHQRHHLPEQAGGVMGASSSSSSSVPYPSARPRSSGHFHGGSPSPYARPSNERHSITAIAHHPPRDVQPAPRMVALAGWPEPIYIDTALSSRSRPPSRRQSFSSIPGSDAENAPQAGWVAHRSSRPFGAMSAGASQRSSRSSSPTGKRKFEDIDQNGSADVAMSRTASAQSRTEYRSSPRNMTPPPYDARPPYPTSSARSSISESEQPFDRDRAAAIHAAQRRFHLEGAPAAAAGTPPPGRRSTFADPRMAPHVGVFSNRGPLAIAPSWVGSEPASSGPVALTGVAIEAGQRGTGILVLPAVPEVYPRRASSISSPHAAATTASPSSPPQRAWSPEGSAMSHGGMGGMDFAGGHRMGSLASAFAGLVSGGGAGMMPGMATEMYPRDPESPMWWVNDVPAARAALSPMSVVSPPPSGSLTPMSVSTDTVPSSAHPPFRAGSMDGHRPTVRFKADSRPASPGVSPRQQHASARMHKPTVLARYKADEERSEMLSVHAQ